MDGLRIKMHPRLDIAETFIPNPEGKKEVDHINRDRSCNFVSNLRWADDVEQQENTDKTDAVIKAFGVRARDDKKAWTKAYKEARRQCLMEGREWVATRFRRKEEK